MQSLFKNTLTTGKFLTFSQFILYFFLFSVILPGCKDKDDDNPQPEPVTPVVVSKTKLTFKFNHFSGTYFISNAGDTITINKLKFIMSNFILEKTNGDLVKIPDAYGFLSLMDGIDSFVLDSVPLGDYKSLKLTVGLDPDINHGDPLQWPNGHALNPSVNNMQWNWAGGYIFNVIEGTYKNMGFDKGLSFHVALDKNVRIHQFATNFSITKNNKFTMFVATEKYFSNVVNYSLKTDGDFSHSGDPDPAMDKFIQNVGVISFTEFK